MRVPALCTDDCSVQCVTTLKSDTLVTFMHERLWPLEEMGGDRKN